MKPKIIPGYDCVGEVRKIRESMAKQCNYDFATFCAYISSCTEALEKEWGVKFIGDDEE